MSKLHNEPVQVDLFGDTTPVPPMKPTALQKRVIQAAIDSADEPPDRIDYMHAVLCQIGMPRQQTKARTFERTSGGVMMRLEAGVLGDGLRWIEQPLPYGPKPRLIMVHVCGEAIRTQSRHVEIGHSTREFMKRIGADVNSRGYAMMRKQMLALAACELRMSYRVGDMARTIKTHPIEDFIAWLQNEDGQQVMWPGTLELSEKFYETLSAHAVPLDPRHLGALKHSALALDIYTWLAHRLCRVRNTQGQLVRWNKVKEQFGQEYNDDKNFRRKFLIALREVATAYHKAQVDVIPGGLLLRNSPPPIEKTQVQVLLPASKKLA